MRRYQRRHQTLAIGLAGLAGFVDALAFLKLGGLFVSFMSGNSTRMAAGVATATHGSGLAGALILAFVAGVMAGSGVSARAGARRKQAVLALVAVMLILASVAETAFHQPVAPLLIMAASMGTANTVFQREGEVSIGVTYMTGTLVKFGQHLMGALLGGPPLGWLPYLLLWLGLVIGAVAGSAMFAVLGLGALWVAAAISLALLVGSIAVGLSPPDG